MGAVSDKIRTSVCRELQVTAQETAKSLVSRTVYVCQTMWSFQVSLDLSRNPAFGCQKIN